MPESDEIETSENEGEKSSYETVVDTDEETVETPEEEVVNSSPGNAWKTPHALAYVIRHTMLADGEVIEGELNWMQVAFDEYDEQGIEVQDVWDDVDEEAQTLKFRMGAYANYIFNNCILYLNDKLEESQKARLVQILMQICAQDNVIKNDEYVTLILIAKTFFPGQEHEGVTNVLKNAGITIEK